MRRLAAFWRGELPLADSFWTWAVTGGLALNIATGLLFLVLIANGRPVAALILGHAIPLPCNLVLAVGVWRAAGRYQGNPRWASLARGTTVILMAVLSLV